MTPEGIIRLKMDEGCTLTAYQDQGGIWTIGYGHTGPDVCEGVTWTQAQADAQLWADIATVERGLEGHLAWAHSLSETRLDVLVNIAFNVGVAGLLRWPTTLGHIASGKYAQAANDLLNEGKWNRDVGKRADRLSRAMLTDSWSQVA